MRDEISPAISLLLDRASTHVARVERHIDALKARSELQQGRLENSSDPANSKKGKGLSGGGGRSNSRKPLSGEAKLRARAVHQKKEALQYSVERLELEVLQKERELRKRLDVAA